MDSIKLTESHKEKLLKMCKILFPEYCYKCEEYTTYWIDPITDFIWLVRKENPKIEYSKTINKICIHWFEFCMTHLSTILYNKLQPSATITLFRGHLIQDVNHPVDYLYEEFKKLK